nr:hypothetical protein [Bacteroidota bacterium]
MYIVLKCIGMLLGVILIQYYSFAQLQNNIWYFGEKAGIDFNGSLPIAIAGNLNALEGTASICDAIGTLLFYTNGATIWDRNGVAMPNGSGLSGGESSTQAALIVPFPKSCNQYYVFTTQDHSTDGGMHYSVVDMCLNNGLGDIVPSSKDILVVDRTTEKLTTVLHENGVDIWIITHPLASADYLSYLLTETGLNPTPIVSSIGFFYSSQAIIGPIKASHDGTKIASSATFHNICEMFDFNASTGTLSNYFNLNQLLSGQNFVYGIEFSTNDNLLYLSTTFVQNSLYQINLQTQDLTTLHNLPGNYIFGALQSGPNGKIYMARNESDFLDVIHQPDLAGTACQYEQSGILLANGTICKLGLPNFVPYALEPDTIHSTILGKDTTVCGDVSIHYELSVLSDCAISYLWNDGLTDPDRIITTPGLFWIEAVGNCAIVKDTIVISQGELAETWISRTICEGNMYEGYSVSGSYTDTLMTQSGCDSIRKLELTVTLMLSPTVTATICEGQFYEGYFLSGIYQDTFVSTAGCDSIRILDLSVTSEIFLQEEISICQGQVYQGYTLAGIYQDTFITAAGCDSIRILDLLVTTEIFTEEEISICTGQSYQGYTTEGMYQDSFVNISGCDSIRTLILTISEEIRTAASASLCEGPALGHAQPGIYTDTLISIGQCDSLRTLTVVGATQYIPNVFSPNGDNINDLFSIIQFPDDFLTLHYFSIFDLFGDMVYE